jgi:hypothetical protein
MTVFLIAHILAGLLGLVFGYIALFRQRVLRPTAGAARCSST